LLFKIYYLRVAGEAAVEIQSPDIAVDVTRRASEREFGVHGARKGDRSNSDV